MSLSPDLLPTRNHTDHFHKTHPFSENQDLLQFVKGVGPLLAQKFSKKNIHTIYDLLYFFPRTYRIKKRISNISQLEHGQYAVVEGEIFSKNTQGRYRSTYTITLQINNDHFVLIKYFKLPYRGFFDSLEIGQTVKIFGIVRLYKNQFEFHHPEFLTANDQEEIVPVYSEIEGISQKKIRNLISKVFEQINNHIDDFLPNEIREKFQLLSLLESLKDIHQPKRNSPESYLHYQSDAQKRLIFEEFFQMQLYLSLRKLKLKDNESIPLICEEKITNQFRQSLPFQWTESQKNVFEEIQQDLKKAKAMRRLIQGDVGCGKTVVAFQACCYAIESGMQVAFMSPTEILSEQHFQQAKKWMSSLGFNIQLLTAQTKNKKSVLSQLESGECQLCIGTQSLIQEKVKFKNLGLIVIDEQHRFGVDQRFQLLEKGQSPHCLMLTATPIPRTLAMTLYSDLDISTIKDKPKGRLPVITKQSNKRGAVFSFLEKEVLSGGQAYVVYPLVEESEKVYLKDAVLQFEKLKTSFPKIQWGLLHGKMNDSEKSQIIQDFIHKKIQVLVTTTVIEVGLDVSNANVMVIEHGERFGLSQLHQLRGRVGRGTSKSYCIIILGKNSSKEAFMRAKIMESTQDGFLIAEEDLKLRGAGNMMGTKQSGHFQFHIANMYRDVDILKQSKKAVHLLTDKDPSLETYPQLKKILSPFKV